MEASAPGWETTLTDAWVISGHRGEFSIREAGDDGSYAGQRFCKAWDNPDTPLPEWVEPFRDGTLTEEELQALGKPSCVLQLYTAEEQHTVALDLLASDEWRGPS